MFKQTVSITQRYSARSDLNESRSRRDSEDRLPERVNAGSRPRLAATCRFTNEMKVRLSQQSVSDPAVYTATYHRVSSRASPSECPSRTSDSIETVMRAITVDRTMPLDIQLSGEGRAGADSIVLAVERADDLNKVCGAWLLREYSFWPDRPQPRRETRVHCKHHGQWPAGNGG